MNDLVERQAAIDAVEESRRLNHHQDGKEACAHEYEHRHFLKLLRDLPAAQPGQRWMSLHEPYGKEANCDDNRFKLIQKYRDKLIDGTNIESSENEMAVLDNLLFRFWQMGWLDKLEKDGD